ncbi:putative transmembrane protein [Senna tora]|uniref:Putative transmembrane protein n=1 Tax=Senna tora TaxID=362788 RepID=A0A834WI00_9FABA|nr:putative transmembrane protein [Senna tora]
MERSSEAQMELDGDEEWKRNEYSGGRVLKRVGKQFLVASLVASSAPLLLPPLVVVSVIGISVSVPYGLLLATHVCTHKLMSKLLPMPRNEPQAEVVDDTGNEIGELEKETKGLDFIKETKSSNDMRDIEHAEARRKSTQFEHFSAKDINEVKLKEEKIWKEINAIKLIVGYEGTGTPQASCEDELKNLYTFTGVEPPTHLNHSTDPLEINHNLHFLMSILGLKSTVP